jgi:all-trans-retinol 13,14-reductase
MTFDVALIGSGPSCLTSAVLLAQAGKSVCVLEQHTKPGGYLHCFERYGHRFDTGGHYIGAMETGQPFRVLLEHLGVFHQDDFIALDPNGYDVFNFRSFEIAMPRGYQATIDRLSEFFPSEAHGIQEFFSKVHGATQSFPTYRYDDGLADHDLLSELMSVSLQQVVESCTKHPELQAVLYSHCTLHGVAPADIGFGLHAVVIDSLMIGAHGFRHGGDRLAGRFVKKIESLGGEVRTACLVSKIKPNGNDTISLELAHGEEITAARVISGIHPTTTYRMVEDFVPSRALDRRLNGVGQSIGFLGLYLSSNFEGFDPLRNYYLFESSSPESFEFLRDQNMVDQNHVMGAFVSTPDRVDPGISEPSKSPPGYRPISVHIPAPYHWFREWESCVGGRKPRVYHALKRDLGAQGISFVESSYPGFAASIKDYDVSTPLSNIHYNKTLEGSPYGIYHSVKNTGARAFGPRTHIPGLFLTGQNCLMPGILGAAVAGLRTAGQILGTKPILRDLKQRSAPSNELL